jgi:pSer/pThr/pTyr-binding forkhead associated (FHA) protein
MPRVTITVPEKNAQPYRFQLDSGAVTVGRGSDNDITIESGSVSVHHAEMRRIKGGYELCDIGSTNGIKLDGVRYETIPLRSGMTVTIGEVAFDFSLSEEEMRELAREEPAEPSPIVFEPAVQQSGPPKKEVIYVPVNSSGSGSSGMIVFLILAAISFFVGLAVRHQKETGGSLIDAIKAKYSVPQATPVVPK